MKFSRQLIVSHDIYLCENPSKLKVQSCQLHQTISFPAVIVPAATLLGARSKESRNAHYAHVNKGKSRGARVLH